MAWKLFSCRFLRWIGFTQWFSVPYSGALWSCGRTRTPDKHLSLKRYFLRYQISQGGGFNRNHKFSSSLYKDIIRCRKFVGKKATKGGSLNHLLSLQRYFWDIKLYRGGGLNTNLKFSSSLYQDIIRCRKFVGKKANKGGSLNHLLSLQRIFFEI